MRIAPINLKTFVDKDRIILGLSESSQKVILEKLITPLNKAGIISDTEQILRDLQQRESEITTVMGNGVAIPHARSHAVKRLGLSVGLVENDGIQFNEEIDTPCRLIFCIVIPAFAPTSHMPLLQLLAKFARDPRRVEKMLQFKTAVSISRYLTAYKG